MHSRHIQIHTRSKYIRATIFGWYALSRRMWSVTSRQVCWLSEIIHFGCIENHFGYSEIDWVVKKICSGILNQKYLAVTIPKTELGFVKFNRKYVLFCDYLCVGFIIIFEIFSLLFSLKLSNNLKIEYLQYIVICELAEGSLAYHQIVWRTSYCTTNYPQNRLTKSNDTSITNFRILVEYLTFCSQIKVIILNRKFVKILTKYFNTILIYGLWNDRDAYSKITKFVIISTRHDIFEWSLFCIIQTLVEKRLLKFT